MGFRFGGFRSPARRNGAAALPTALLLLALAGEPVAAQQAQVIAEGKQDYDETCAACHGPEGRGNGPMAGLLVLPPSDLTRVAKDAGGAFPFWRVYRIIMGGQVARFGLV
ncbi:MAG TPA: c-type cytochrome, partial [Dongiaceae bacterium]|nr:c-type cytochrome [Dongiaceae bacterium]